MRNTLNEILKELSRIKGIDFNGYKRDFLKKTILLRMERLKFHDISLYFKYLQSDSTEYDHLFETISIKVSSFFRNPIVFEIIAQQILPQIIESKKQSGIRQIRVWSAGCATGEEAYSIAILIHDALKNEEKNWHPFIFATDISDEALYKAITGIYRRENFENTKLGILDKYFVTDGEFYKICPFIQKMVGFSSDDLTSGKRFAPPDSVFGTFDLILCRNVLIYFSSHLQKKVAEKFYKALDKGGFLILGDSESLNFETERELTTIDVRNRIFQKK